MISRIKCCRDCQKRYLGCHAECKVYQEQKDELNKYNATVRKEKEKKNDFMAFKMDAVCKVMRKKQSER